MKQILLTEEEMVFLVLFYFHGKSFENQIDSDIYEQLLVSEAFVMPFIVFQRNMINLIHRCLSNRNHFEARNPIIGCVQERMD